MLMLSLKILVEKKAMLDKIVAVLLEKETMEQEEFNIIMGIKPREKVPEIKPDLNRPAPINPTDKEIQPEDKEKETKKEPIPEAVPTPNPVDNI